MTSTRFQSLSTWLLSLAVLGGFFPGYADAVCSKKKSYDDCLLEGLKGTTSDVAAQAIKRACIEKFPGRTKKILRLSSPSAIERVTGTVSTGYGSLSGNLYNGSPFHITGATLSIRPKVKDLEGKPLDRIFAIELNAPINTTGGFCISIDDAFAKSIGNGFDWSVVDISVIKDE